MESYFLSQKNYTLLYEVVKTGLFKRWNYDISSDRENGFLEKMRTIMRQIYNDRSKFNIDERAPIPDNIRTLNKYTLDFIMPHFGEIIQYTISTKKTELPPQVSMRDEKQVSFNPQVSVHSGGAIMQRSHSSRIEDKGSIMENYQRLNNERDNTLNTNVPKPIDFSLPTGDKTDPSDRYLTMQSQRDSEIERFKHIREATQNEGEGSIMNTQPIPSPSDIKITPGGLESYGNMNAQNFAQSSFNDMTEQKARIDRSVESSLEELTSKRDKLFQDMATFKQTKFGKEEFSGPTLNKGHNPIENRNSDVFFNNDKSSVDQNILFREDKSIKAQYEARMNRPEEPRGIAFKPPVETEYRTHYITIDSRDRVQSTTNTAVNFVVKFPYIRLKNIKSIKMLSAILPNEESIRNEPYVLVSIPEIDGPMYSSNNRNMKIFTKIFNNKNTHNTALHYLNYMPEPIKKEYPINALGSLEQLSLQLHKHNGADLTLTGGTGGGDDPTDITSFTFEIVQTVADTSALQSDLI